MGNLYVCVGGFKGTYQQVDRQTWENMKVYACGIVDDTKAMFFE